DPFAQSAGFVHALSSAHGMQVPPQSTSTSVPFFMPSVHVAVGGASAGASIIIIMPASAGGAVVSGRSASVSKLDRDVAHAHEKRRKTARMRRSYSITIGASMSSGSLAEGSFGSQRLPFFFHLRGTLSMPIGKMRSR